MIYELVRKYAQGGAEWRKVVDAARQLTVEYDEPVDNPYMNEDPTGTFAELTAAVFAFDLSPEEYEELRAALTESDTATAGGVHVPLDLG